MRNTVENEYVHLEIKEEILIATYKVKSITYDIAIKVVNFRKDFMADKKYHALIKDDNTISIDKKARDFFASKEGIEGIQSVAVLTNSIYKSTLMNFFIKILPPKMPVKLFNTEQKALAWLKENKSRPNE
jgi:hypothetical protein